MNALFARALGAGVERAALLTFEQAMGMLEARDGTSEVVRDNVSDEWVNLEIEPIQALRDFDGECIEMRILVGDGHREVKTYFYVRPESGGVSAQK